MRGFDLQFSGLHVTILIRPDDPNERLQIYHVARAEVPLILTDLFSELEKAAIYLPRWCRGVFKVGSIFQGRSLCSIWLKEYVNFGLGDKRKDRDDRVRQNPG